MSVRKSTSRKRLYRIQFLNQGKVYEVYARHVTQSPIFGFIEIEGLVFGEKSSLVIDPAEDRLKSEFEGVPLTHVPMQAVIRIDEVEKQGTAKIVPLDGGSGNVLAYPFPGLGPAPRKG